MRRATPSGIGRPPPQPVNGSDGAHSAAARGLNLPLSARVDAAPDGTPQMVNDHPIAQVRESWLVEDRWWTDRPLRRRYWEVVSAHGRNLVVFHDLQTGGWFTQRSTA
jgi:hypothetical protein